MKILYLLIIIIGVATQNVVRKRYTVDAKDGGVYLFTALSSLAAALFFICTSGKMSWNSGIIPYAIGFAVSFATTTLFSVLAINCGSLSLSSLFISYSLMLPTLYGLIFLKESIGIGLIPGLILLVLSLFFINKKSDKSPITLKWFIYVFLSFLGNGMCSVVQKMQQVKFEGAYKNEFMTVALVIVAIIMSIASIVKERKDIKLYIKIGWHLALICGIMVGAVNLFVMILSGSMPASIMFPLISAGGIVITFLISTFWYKEQLSRAQLVGLILGVASIVFLNI